MSDTPGRAAVSALVLIAGTASAEQAPVWQVAIAHDFLLPDDGPPVHQ